MSDVLIVDGIEFRVFDDFHAATKDGIVMLTRTRKIARQFNMPSGYRTTSRGRLVHRIVATCWVPRPEGTDEVHHINGDKSDNRSENLAWVSKRDHRSMLHDHGGRYVRTEATRQKLREAKLGKKRSAESVQKQMETRRRLGLKLPKGRPLGMKMSAEHCAHMSATHWANTLCEIEGVRYRSFSDAGKTLGILPHTIRKRCLSSNFPDYRIVESPSDLS